MQRRYRVLATGTIALLLLLWWWNTPGEGAAGGDDVVSLRPVLGAKAPVDPRPGTVDAPRTAATTRPPVEAPEQPALDEEELARVYDQLEAGRRVRCDAGDVLADGAYSARGASWVQVRGGILTAAVPTSSGEARLSEHLAPVGLLEWSNAAEGAWGSCDVTPPRRVQVQGTLRHADGTPAEGFAVRGCIHGAFAITNAEGQWSDFGIDGTTCHPMAFVETEDGRFGRSEPVEIALVAPGPIQGVDLTLPGPSQLWSMDTQRAMAPQLAAMLEKQMAEQRSALDRAKSALRGVESDALAAFFQRFVDDEQLLLDRMTSHRERLDDADEGPAALRESWMNLN